MEIKWNQISSDNSLFRAEDDNYVLYLQKYGLESYLYELHNKGNSGELYAIKRDLVENLETAKHLCEQLYLEYKNGTKI